MIEKVKDGNITCREHIGVTADGVFRYTANGKVYDPPLCLLKLPVRKGETWRIDVRLGENVLRDRLHGS